MFSDANVRNVVLGCILLASSSAVVGCFTFLRKKALISEAVTHAVLPGICIGFLVKEVKDPVFLLIGAFVAGWLALICIDWIVNNSKLKQDTAIALVLSVFFGLGIMLLTNIQHTGIAAQAGLEEYLFGNAASLTGKDLQVFSITAVLLVVIIFAFYKEFTLIAFDRNFAISMGLPVQKLDHLLTSLTVLAIIIGIQAVGVVLMAAMLITPAAAARYWTEKLSIMILVAVLFSSVSGVSGAFVSYMVPSVPTGPCIIISLSIIAIFSFVFGKTGGMLYKNTRTN